MRPRPWPQKSRTTEKRCASTKVWMAWPMSPTVAPGCTDLDAAQHRLVGDVDQPLRLHADLADAVHPAGIAVPAVEDGGDVDVDDVAVLQPLVARNAVADDVIDRGADRLREAAIVERRRDRAVIADELVAQPVELVGASRPAATCGVMKSSVSAARRPARRMPSKSSAPMDLDRCARRPSDGVPSHVVHPCDHVRWSIPPSLIPCRAGRRIRQLAESTRIDGGTSQR